MTVTPNQPTLTPAQHHRNAQLFSDHYLDHILPAGPDWRSLVQQAAVVRNELHVILAAFEPTTSEADTEYKLIRPVLEKLGHTFAVQSALKVPDGTKVPDYVLYHDVAARSALKGKVLDDALLAGHAFGVAEAKHWDRPLDKALTGAIDAFNNKNPAYQIAFYVQHAGVAWGILTNGRLWRLVHKDTAHKLDRYYEVDLPGLLEPDLPGGDTADAFLYFYAFFRRAAFDPGFLSLDRFLAESADYAREVGEGLKVQVYDALRHLAQGFLDYGLNGFLTPAQDAPEAGALTPETLKAIYDHSLIVLYRLLFVFYAEARDLLPLVDSQSYRDHYSLRALTRQVARDAAAGSPLLPDSALLWPRLQQLFRIINAGSPPLKVATFNGGLFDPTRYPFLERYTVGDAHLAAAIDGLARLKGEFIDYRDLAERHLGTIYEGLLEHHLEPTAPAGGWTVDLFNDRGERKRSGSYYTPDAIVKYIVEQTVGPALKQAIDGAPSTDPQRRSDAILGLNCLDPAMGSGHFLVEVVEQIARFLVDQGLVGEEAGESDLAYWKRRVAGSCVYGVDLNPLAVDLAKLSLWLSTAAKDRPLSFLDHHLRVGNSLVGARLADLGAPGANGAAAPTPTERKAARKAAKVAAQAEAAGQTSMLDDDAFRQSLSTAVGSMWLIEGIKGLTVAEVKQQEQLYLALRETLARRYGMLADLATARRFGLQVDPELAPRLAAYAVGKSVARFPQFDALLSQVEDLAARHRFFHWELEFPEVFFDKHGYALGERAGFDVVVGNPPYVRQETLAPYKPYFASAFTEMHHGVADLSLYFIAQGAKLLRANGVLGFITSGTFRKLASGAPLRQWLTSNTTLSEVTTFGEAQVFPDATTYPILLCFRKVRPSSPVKLLVREVTDISQLPRRDEGELQAAPHGSSPWTFGRPLLSRLTVDWPQARTLLATIGTKVNRGVSTGLNDAFVLNTSAKNKLVSQYPEVVTLLKNYVRGEDLKVWCQEESDLWLLFVRRGTDVERYPGALAHLTPFRDKLTPRPKEWTGKEWKGRKPGNYEWYEIQDSVEYYEVFEQPRIHSTKVTLWPSCSLCETPKYAANTSYIIPCKDIALGYYVLALLNSHIGEYFMRAVSSPKASGYYEVQPAGLESFPVPSADPTTRAAVASLAKQASGIAASRYTLHRQARHRILTDLGQPGGKLNLKLTAWWELDFPALRAEVQKVFRQDIPLKQRDEWEAWLNEKRGAHARMTAEIVRLETELNARVYELFDLTPAEIKIIEESTKYKYGEV